jgi:hypothetical protein
MGLGRQSLSAVGGAAESDNRRQLHTRLVTDGSRLVVATREAADDLAARATFNRLVDGPVIVHSSKETFLDWDALRRPIDAVR